MNIHSAQKKMILAAFGLMVAAGIVGCSSGDKSPTAKNSNVNQLIQDLKGQDPQKRQDAEADLATLGPQAAPAVPALIELMKDKDPVVRRLAAFALGQVGPGAKAALPVLKEGMSDSDRTVATASLNAVRAIDIKEAEGVQVYNVQSAPPPKP